MSDVYIAYVFFLSFERTKNFCFTIVTHIVVGDLCKNVRQFYLKFLKGVFNRTLSMYVQQLYLISKCFVTVPPPRLTKLATSISEVPLTSKDDIGSDDTDRRASLHATQMPLSTMPKKLKQRLIMSDEMHDYSEIYTPSNEVKRVKVSLFALETVLFLVWR